MGFAQKFAALVVDFPMLAAGIAWMMAPEPKHEVTWRASYYPDDPALVISLNYFQYILLDDLDHSMRTTALGDVMYMRMPEEAQQKMTRQDFGKMASSARQANCVDIAIAGDDTSTVRTVVETIDVNLAEIANLYMVPSEY